MTTAIVLGSTGLVGSQLIRELQAAPYYSSVVLLNRRPSGYSGTTISERIIDFDAPDLNGISGEHLYCALGTTLRKAGSKAAQFTIDCEYPTTIATRLRERGTKQVILVSSIGANAGASSFYLRTKGQLEENIIGLGFESTVICRPSVLIGERIESRPGEKAAALLLKILSPLLLGALRKYRGVQASDVAARMVREAQASARGVRIIEFD